MKILCIADIHGSMKELEKAIKFAKENKINFILILGDLSGRERFRNMDMNKEDAAQVLNILKEFEILAIPGNCDSIPTIEFLEKNRINLHEKIKIINDISLAGFGGSSPTPFDTPFEFSEKEIYDKLKKLIEKVKTKKTILALHTPPKNTNCDITGNGGHIGSESIRKIIEEFQPNLVVSSHVHESAGTRDKIRNTEIANIGPISGGNIGIIEIENGVKIELMKI